MKKPTRWTTEQVLKYIADSHKEGLSFKEMHALLIERNIVSARHGKPFSESTLRSYSSGMKDGGKFSPNPDTASPIEIAMSHIRAILTEDMKDSVKVALIRKTVERI